MIGSENDLQKRMRKSICRINYTYHNRIGMASTCEKTTCEIAPIGAISLLCRYAKLRDRKLAKFKVVG